MPLLTAAALLLGGLGCNAISSLGSDPTATPRPTAVEEPTEEVVVEEPTEEVVEEPTEEPTEEIVEEPTEEVIEEPTLTFEDTPEGPAGDVLFEDSFDEDVNGWDVDSDDTSAREFRDGIYSIQVFNTVWFAWANPVTDEFEDIHLQVTVSNAGGNDPAFGVICSYVDADAFYFLGFGDDGYYGIARIEGDDFNLLTGDGESWAQSDDIELFQDSYQLEADCHADGTLRLIVDGVTIAEAQDADPYGAGGIGLFVQSFDNVPVDVEFDDLVVTAITE
jgi:hypothetical protein